MKIKNQRENQSLTVVEAGRRGGQKTLERYGIEYFREIGRKGGEVTTRKYQKLLAWWGQQGGRPRRPKLGDCAAIKKTGGSGQPIP